MSLVKQIEDKGAVVEWCPLPTEKNLVALGTKDSSGVGFDDYGGEVEIYSLNLSNSSQNCSLVGKARASARFSSLAWSPMNINQSQYPSGLLAGGMMDGFINVWDPSKFSLSEDPSNQPLIASVEQHQGAINGLQFNPHTESSHLLASGGNDGEVFVMSLERPDQPNVFIPAPPPNNAKHTADITKVQWNTQVAHILASASQNGVTYIWDLRQKKAWCELRDPSGGSIIDIAWNPDQGLHIITASGEDRNPIIKLWDLRSSTSIPLASLQGHTQGVLSVSWNPHDSSYLMSCGKDNKTFLWDLYNAQPVYELPTKSTGSNTTSNTSNENLLISNVGLGGISSANNVFNSNGFTGNNSGGVSGFDTVSQSNSLFGNIANTVGQRRQYVSWSPSLKSVIATTTFDRKVQFYSLSGVVTKNKRTPKWLKTPSGVNFSFGGKLLSFDHSNIIDPQTGLKRQGTGNPQIKLHQIIEDNTLVSSCDQFHQFIQAHGVNGYKDYCLKKSENTDISMKERKIWELMNVICFGTNAREELLSYLGFKQQHIADTVQQYLESKSSSLLPPKSENLPPNSPPTTTPTATTTTAVESMTSSIQNILLSAKSSDTAEDIFGAGGPINGTSTTDFFSAPPPISPNLSVPSPTTTTTPALIPIQKDTKVIEETTTTTTTTTANIPLTQEEIETEHIIREAIIVGNFKAAVDCCLQSGQWAEALILAQCGDQTLWVSTQQYFFEKQKKKHQFLTILHAIIKNDLSNYVATSDLSKWKETLAVLSTYGKSDEFPTMCEKLAERLQVELNDKESATLCYMCAANVSQTIHFWTNELKIENDRLGYMNPIALQHYIEKVTVFTQVNPSITLPQECSNYFAEYANLLASQGRFDIALTYLRGNTIAERILIDRLFHASTLQKTPNTKLPVFPFDKITVEVSTTNKGGLTTSAATAGVSTATTSTKQIVSQATTTIPGTSRIGALPTTNTNLSINSQKVLAPGWSQGVDASSGRTYYYNQSTGQSQWEAPLVDVVQSVPTQPSVVPTPTAVSMPQQTAPVSTYNRPMQTNLTPVSTMGGASGYGSLSNPNMSQMANNQSTPTQPQVFQPRPGGLPGTTTTTNTYTQPTTPIQSNPMSMGQPTQPNMYGSNYGTPNTISQPQFSNNTQSQQPTIMNPTIYTPVSNTGPSMTAKVATPTPAPEPPQPKVLLPDSEAVLLLEQVINAVTAAASPAEKRQMSMVNDAFACLRKKGQEGEVSQDILNKIHQLANDIMIRNFASASAIQADLANTAWNLHKEWIKGLKVFIQIASKK